MRLKWRDVVDNITQVQDREATIEDITKFVNAKARAVSHPIFGKISEPEKNAQIKGPGKRSNGFGGFRAASYGTQVDRASRDANGANITEPKCPLCKSNHWLARCREFRGKSLEDRLRIVKDKGLCNNCLTIGHFARRCPKDSFCKVEGCRAKHSTFLHPKPTTNSQGQRAGTIADSSDMALSQPDLPHSETAASSFVNMSSKSTISSAIGLAILPVKVKSPGNPAVVETYAFLDNGSNASFCTEQLLNRLGLEGRQSKISLTTLRGTNESVRCSLVDLQVFDLNEENMIEIPSVYSTPSLPVNKEDIATREDIDRWPHLNGVEVPAIDAEIGLLIGSNVPQVLQPREIRVGEHGGPYATKTLLGWTVNGPLGRLSDREGLYTNFVKADAALSQHFERFCNLEFNDSADNDLAMSRNDLRALSVMEETAQLKENHYEIALPWKSDPPRLEDNRPMAEHRLHLLKRRLARDSTTHEKYKCFMEDLIEKGHARPVPREEPNPSAARWYLPHHPVYHPQKPGKLRVVFDCAAKWRGTSLNDQLLQGPDLTQSLVGVLSRFRQERVALMSDVEAMFHQVRVRPRDRSYLRFLWWPDGNFNSSPEEFQMTVHLFGATSSPSCANFALRKTAKDNATEGNSQAVETVLKNFYVDDCLKSVATTEEAVKLAGDLSDLLAKGGFRLTKWLSNDKEVLKSIPETERATSVKILDFGDVLTERALGVQWNVNHDKFTFKIAAKDKPPTRRGILSIVSSVYDPLGFVSPYVLQAKIILQELCRKKLKKWDDHILDSDLMKWKEWLRELPKLERFQVERCFKPAEFSTIESCELHHFSDASELGYGAVSYIRLVNELGDVRCSLVMAKSRLAPLKAITIPRLELSAAVLAVRLDRMIRQEITLPIKSSTFWTDSTCVLRYIRNKEKRFQTFVANRVTRILEQSQEAQWRYVDTTSNPADEASRGMSVDSLINDLRWTRGPRFLRSPPESWLSQPIDLGPIPENDPEVKTESKVCLAGVAEQENPLSKIFQRYSSWRQLKKTIAWILRYKANLLQFVSGRRKGASLPPSSVPIKPLSIKELDDAEAAIVTCVQEQCFREDLKFLKHASKVEGRMAVIPRSSNIYKLDPMLIDGVIRVGGRLHKAPINSNAKHPVILPRKHHVVNLIIRHYHSLSGHSGTEYTLSLMREKFWPINARAAVKQVTSLCFYCKKGRASPSQQKMASLPLDRVTPSRPPFTYVGVDCFGPFQVKHGRSSVKRYGVLFTCLTVRAVHIEVANSLDTDSFLNALRRFIARRGPPEEMRSDNGGNFVCGEKELREAIKEWNQTRIHNHLLQFNTKWTFNPPASSHHGGAWERCIRSVRKVSPCLKKTLSDSKNHAIYRNVVSKN
ncbi:PREDICTED: uncharacterized protein LOC107327368 [Acropora digitifera]|uniref:uncharacterized protein LOC107327368 n=1 Tax=Acropora digitifera TaxID=70779 RepID=UPI00077AF520|nr:PREDICTED: uncharacterized protein LOC107327368 [Acropora digitifera]